MRGRKAASNAAVLIVLIALLIILYVLFLPPAERAILLGEQPGTPGDPGGPESRILFSTVPGQAQQVQPDVRPFGTFTVRTVTSGNVLAARDSLAFSNSIFHTENAVLPFAVPTNTDNVVVSFAAQEAEGTMYVYLNGELIASQEVQQRQPAPIRVPAEALAVGSNELIFGVSGPGFTFWDASEYVLRNVRITGDVTSYDRADMVQRFVVDEPTTVDRAQFSFVPECFEDAGRLTVMLNSETLWTGFPECGMLIHTEIGTGRLQRGENTLRFQVEEGAYVIDQAAIELLPKEESVAEHFSLSPELLSRLVAEDRDLLMRLTFAGSNARGVISLNGERLAFRTAKQSFAAPITPYVQAGRNTVEVLDSDVPITALDVLLE